jgi:dihydroxy-acid dehydratase
MKLRSARWFRGAVDDTFEHRTVLRALGHAPESFLGKPMIGIANSWSDYNNCNMPHKYLVEAVKRGVLLAGGVPMEFHTITTQADLMKPSDLMYRNLMAMDVEETVRSMPMDGLVLLCECDKTCPAQLMAAASCDIPALQLAAGHRASGIFKGKRVTYGTDMWKYFDDYKAGLLTKGELDQLEGCISCSLGGCAVMGTASTMKSLSEMLGMMLPGTASIPATDSRRVVAAEATGRQIVKMVHDDLRPSRLMTGSAFRNAIRLLAAIGGSTNAIIHLIAIAARLGLRLSLDTFQKVMETAPLLANIQPSGKYTMDKFFEAGGAAAVIGELLPLLDHGCLTAFGQTIGEAYSGNRSSAPDIITSLDNPRETSRPIVVLRGNLAPEGAIIKASACSKHLLHHRGKAVVFADYEDMRTRIDDEELAVDESSVLVMKNCGPVGAGMPEWGAIPIPKRLLKRGIRDLVRISDARMSGTAYGAVVLHVAPESAIGGVLAAVQDGDEIELDVPNGQLNLLVDEAVIRRRLAAIKPSTSRHVRGYPRLFAEHVLQAPQGCDLDFLQPKDKAEARFVEPVIGRG